MIIAGPGREFPMNLIQPIREGLESALEYVSEGWASLKQRAAHAMTRFYPASRSVGDVDVPLGPDWGLLAAELRESPDALLLRLEVPGLDRENLEVELLGNRLRIAGEKRYERNEERAQYHLLECAYGRFERVLPLPCEVDADRATANYRNGVLSLRLPKTEGLKARQIGVQPG